MKDNYKTTIEKFKIFEAAVKNKLDETTDKEERLEYLEETVKYLFDVDNEILALYTQCMELINAKDETIKTLETELKDYVKITEDSIALCKKFEAENNRLMSLLMNK